MNILVWTTLLIYSRAVYSLKCDDDTGITYTPCGFGGGSGGSNGNSSKPKPPRNSTIIKPCFDVKYNGPKPQAYVVSANSDVPPEYDLEFTDLNIAAGENLLIKTFRCEPNKQCKIAVIDSQASEPISVIMNQRRFTIASSRPMSATFQIRHNCACSDGNAGDPCNSGCPCKRNTKCINDVCVAGTYQLYDDKKTFNEAKQECISNGGYMPVLLTKADNNALLAAIRKTGSDLQPWIGFEQISHTQYQWVSGETVTIDLSSGDPTSSIKYANFYEDTSEPYLGSVWDKKIHDNLNCFVMSLSLGTWIEDTCNSKRDYACLIFQ